MNHETGCQRKNTEVAGTRGDDEVLGAEARRDPRQNERVRRGILPPFDYILGVPLRVGAVHILGPRQFIAPASAGGRDERVWQVHPRHRRFHVVEGVDVRGEVRLGVLRCFQPASAERSSTNAPNSANDHQIRDAGLARNLRAHHGGIRPGGDEPLPVPAEQRVGRLVVHAEEVILMIAGFHDESRLFGEGACKR